MIKSSIVTFETETVEQMTKLILAHTGGKKLATLTPATPAVETAASAPTRVKRHYAKRHGAPDPWTTRDIVAVAEIVANNLDGRGVGKAVRRYIRNHGDNKRRTDGTLASLASSLRTYLKSSNDKYISQKVKNALATKGIRPSVIKDTSNHENVGATSAVQEA